MFSAQDLESQAITESESWREQQLQFEEQLASQSRAKQEAEVEVERCKQVRDDGWCVLMAVLAIHGSVFLKLLIIVECVKLKEIQYLEEEQHRAKTTLQSRVKDREDEIQKLRNQVRHFKV